MAVIGGGSLRLGMTGASGGVNYMKGMEVVMANLNKEIEGIKVRSVSGLVKAAAFIRVQTESSPPLTPVDYGNLKASWFVTTATAIKVGKGISKFRGPKAAEIASNHETGTSQAMGEVATMTTKDKKFVMMGYSTNYAGFVHEYIGDVAFKRPGAEAKWLETHIKRNTKKIVEIVREDAQIKR